MGTVIPSKSDPLCGQDLIELKVGFETGKWIDTFWLESAQSWAMIYWVLSHLVRLVLMVLGVSCVCLWVKGDSDVASAFKDRDRSKSFEADTVWIHEKTDGSYRLPIIEAKNAIVVLDCSKYMRDPDSGELLPIVLERLEAFLGSMPDLNSIKVLDSDGRKIVSNLAMEYEGGKKMELANVLRSVRDYGRVSDYSYIQGLLNGLRSVRKESGVSVFVFGTQHMDFYTSPIELVEIVERLSKKRDFSLSYVKAHDLDWGDDWTAEGLLTSTRSFDYIGWFLSKRHSGNFYTFQPLGTSRKKEDREGLILLYLSRLHSTVKWAVNGSPAFLESTNRLMWTIESPIRLETVEECDDCQWVFDTLIEEVGHRQAFCYVTLETKDGLRAIEYRARIEYESYGWIIDEWTTIFDD